MTEKANLDKVVKQLLHTRTSFPPRRISSLFLYFNYIQFDDGSQPRAKLMDPSFVFPHFSDLLTPAISVVVRLAPGEFLTKCVMLMMY